MVCRSMSISPKSSTALTSGICSNLTESCINMATPMHPKRNARTALNMTHLSSSRCSRKCISLALVLEPLLFKIPVIPSSLNLSPKVLGFFECSLIEKI